MARSPNDEGSDSDKDSQDDRAHRPHPGDDQHGGAKAQQQQGTQDRDFAPGEDGECH